MGTRRVQVRACDRRPSRNSGGNANQGSKWIRKEKRQRIYARDGHRCVWCNREIGAGVATLDHVIPRSQGGTNEAHNLVTSCSLCNCQRGELSPLQFAQTFARRGRRFEYWHSIAEVLDRVAHAIAQPLPVLRQEARAAE